MWLLTLKSILVATDLDEGSLAALNTAVRLAPLAGATLHLLHVVDSPDPGDHARLMEHFRHIAPDAPEPDSTRVIAGEPATVIVEQAAGVGADAIILGPHRRMGTGAELGSTAASVVQNASCPCLVAATELRLPLERVVVPIDLSEAADGALSVAISWASALRPRSGESLLTALHVSSEGASPPVELEVGERVRRARARAGDAARVEIREMVVHGSEPSDEILRRVVSEAADLLVMATRGTANSTSSLGSVSASVVQATPCPLLLVPPVTWEEQSAG